jgi:hypothetical protein
MILTLLLILALAGGLVPLLQRDLERAAFRQQLRRVVTVTLTFDASAFVAAMRKAERALTDVETQVARMREAFRKAREAGPE